MDYLVSMTTRVPEGTPEEAVQDIRAREAATRASDSPGTPAAWRPPLQPGEWHAGLFAAATATGSKKSSPRGRCGSGAPMRSRLLSPHERPPPTPGAGQKAAEFLVTFTLAVAGHTWQTVQTPRPATRAHDLADQEHLLRLWALPDERALGLYQARDATQMEAILASLPLAPWMTVDITPLSPHPSDPAIIRPPATAPAGTL